MRNLFVSSILVLIFCAAMFAQTNEILPCPTIDLSDSASGMLLQDEPMTFVASLSKEANKFDLKYQWTVSSGEIIQGQHTLIIKVLLKDFAPTLSVAVEILGLPEKCDNTASLAIKYEPPIQAILLDKFSIPISQIEKARLENLKIELNNNPNASVYIIEHFEKKTSRSAITRKNTTIANYLKTQGINKNRIVLLNALTGENLTQFFIVPAGAALPTCEDCIAVELK